MSIEASKWAWQQEVTPSEKLVLLALANYGEHSFPSEDLIAKMTGLSKRTVVRVVKSLAKAGFVGIGKARGVGREFAHNTYTLNRKCHHVTLSETIHHKESKIIVTDRVPPCHLQPLSLPTDFAFSADNARLAAKLENYYPPPDSIEEAFRDWCLMYGHKSYNWQKSARTYMQRILDGQETARQLN